MKNMTLKQIAEACNGTLYDIGASALQEVAGVVIDSRQVQKDYLFIATVGERVDGHSYIDDVYEKGALAVVCEKAPVSPKGPYILVDNSLSALKNIAKWYRAQLDIKVVGITGSVGKTSTKEFISSVLNIKYKVLKTEGNFNNEIGMPLTILKIREEHEIAVLEMGISDFGEMHRLSEIAKPDICVITNIGQCHLENLGTREGILKAKSEIFDFMSDEGYVCLNGDDDMLATIKLVKGRKPITFGMQASNDIYATNIHTKGLWGSTCDVNLKDQVFLANIPLPGEHMILNAMAATSVASILHMTNQEIEQGINLVKPVGGRSNIIKQEKWTIIDDCYNANPVSMKAAIDLLCMADTNKVAILGDMGELGAHELSLHREVGTYAMTKNVDRLICIGQLSKAMFEGAKEASQNNVNNQKRSDYESLLYFENRDEFLPYLPSLVKANDTILVKASHSRGFEHIVKALIEINSPA
jgi:UDP-N-acetylmuramoyl-tripeptide--D-alanyl-D-alanine ligase